MRLDGLVLARPLDVPCIGPCLIHGGYLWKKLPGSQVVTIDGGGKHSPENDAKPKTKMIRTRARRSA